MGIIYFEVKVEKFLEIDMEEEDSDREGGVVIRDFISELFFISCNVEVYCGSKEVKYR